MRVCGFFDVPRVFRMFRAFSKLFVLYQAVIAAKIEFETHAFGANTIYTAGTSHGSAPGLYKVFGLKVGQQSGGRKPIFLGHAIEHAPDDTYLIAVDYAVNVPLLGICPQAVGVLGCPVTEKLIAALSAGYCRFAGQKLLAFAFRNGCPVIKNPLCRKFVCRVERGRRASLFLGAVTVG